ncbi:hypothetical protein HG530_009378 [Fusarium avenaceum]|nr:hypothetical protein HG530_009378 [Fusarium avenaceum]
MARVMLISPSGTVAEGKQRLDLGVVVVPVSHVEAFAVQDFVVLAGPARTSTKKVTIAYRELAAWVLDTEEDIGQRIACFLSLIPALENDRHPIDPWHMHGTARLVNDNCPRVGPDHSLNESVLVSISRKIHRLTIVPLRLPLSIYSDYHNSHISLTSRLNGLLDVVHLVLLLEPNSATAVLVRHAELFLLGDGTEFVGHLHTKFDGLVSFHVHINKVINRAIEHRLAFLRPVPQIEYQLSIDVKLPGSYAHEADALGESHFLLRHLADAVERNGVIVRVQARTSTTTCNVSIGIWSDDGDFGRLGTDREDVAVVLEKRETFVAGSSDQLSRFLAVIFALWSLWRHVTSFESFHQCEYILCCSVDMLYRHAALFDGSNKLVETPFG